jgi:beta-glucosidase/6-phospho-beta-glucosidase/beta-galactosidase
MTPQTSPRQNNAWNARETIFLHPIFTGHYHPDTVDAIGDQLPEIKSGDMALISQKLDFLGINSYSRSVISAKQGRLEKIPGSEYTEMGWEVCAPAFRRMLVKINNDYCLPPVYITENGAAFKDVVTLMENPRCRLRLPAPAFHPGASRHAGRGGHPRLLRLVPAR